MSAERGREYLKERGLEDGITTHRETINSEGEIAKTLSFLVDEKPVIVVMAGGDAFTSVRITPEELEQAAGAAGWCDVYKNVQEI